ncbi:EboA domain-containing protein [Streptomyces chartreusis]|uniref:EboA domain-containing protein n=1 Tax=Streptomyces chartreusis TaxID=1969 RepID=UPI003697D72A
MTHPRTSPATPDADTESHPPTEGHASTDAHSPTEGHPPTENPLPTERQAYSEAGPADAKRHDTGAEPQAHPEDDKPLALTPPTELRAHLAARLHSAARAWLHRALDEAAANPGTHGPISVWELRIAEAGRRCGPDHADAARVLILHAARADTDALSRVYFQGTGAERRAVLHALPHLVPGPQALPLVEDALRTNDTRLLAAAVGPYAARHLDSHQWRHAVLKCLFTGVHVETVADLDRRAHRDTELARMLGDYAAERTAAGRPVPEDLYRVLTLTDPTATPPASAAQRGGRGTDGKES